MFRRRTIWFHPTIKRAAAAALLLLAACSSPPAVTRVTLQPAHPFTLSDQNGKRVTVGRSGEIPAAVYFGFAHCKDICPQTIERLGRARSDAGLTPAQVRIVMVSVDPARDTPAALKRFIAKTGVDAQALTGSLRALHPIYKAYGIVIFPDRTGDLTHTDYVYLIDRQGRLASAVTSTTPMSAVARSLKSLVQ